MEEGTAVADDVVLYEVIDDHIAIVTLNRPKVRNAVNGEITQALAKLVKQIEADDSIRVAVLASSNDRVFCAGADLAEISAGRGHTLMTPDGGFAGFEFAKRTKPWIAEVRGFALAGGCELVLSCDMIVATEDAQFGVPEVKRGLYAGAGGTFRLPRYIPRNVALELVATGDPIPVTRAYELGLVNRVAPLEQIRETTLGLARAISVNAPMSVRESLAVARLAPEQTEADIRIISQAAADRVFASEDAREGPLAFLEKRPAKWVGR
jgi:enoyl-CoA hydratase/carnithine racemase